MGGFIKPKKSKIAKSQEGAAQTSLRAAKRFDKLGPIEQQKGTLEAIDLARENIGGYQDEVDESRRLTDLGAQGISAEQIEKYTNPYLQNVLDFAIKDIEESAARRRQERRGIASKSGNDFATSGALNRYQIEDHLADRARQREIGTLSANQRMQAYQQATGLATDERNRQAGAGVTYGNYANQTAQLNASDVASLANVGEMESIPEVNKRMQLTNTIGNYQTAINSAAPSVKEYQKTSTLGTILGTAGALSSIAGNFSGMKMPSFGSAGVGGASATSLMEGGYGTQMASGLGGSDPRLKRNVIRIGTHPIGIGVYEWTYLWGQRAYGVMANELHKVVPEAVTRFMGYEMVDYSMISEEK